MENNKSVKSNNAGFSIIELIIVIAIMAVIGAAAFLTTAVATDKHVNSCAQKITSSLEQTRSITLGKQEGYVEIWQTTGDYVRCQMYIDGKAYGDEVSIGHPGLTVTVNMSDGTSPTLTSLGASHTKISFSRSNGGVIDAVNVESIVVSNGRRQITITIDKFSGRIEMGEVVVL